MTTTAGYPPSPLHKEEPLSAPLRLGPVARTGTCESLAPSLNLDTSSNTQLSASASKYPRIVVKDHLGRTLDTFTTLQDAIYRANWARKKLGEWPKTSFEWRLPKAPVPSRPDYSKAGPKWAALLDQEPDHLLNQDSQTRSGELKSTARRIELAANVRAHVPTVEIAVDDISFVAESLNHLPNLPSFSFLRQSILAGQSTYIQIVASILLHQKQLTATDVRAADWEFPGFCNGCKRSGFCYGCSKNPKPHVHQDVPAMIGGGFRFWKRDRPNDPQNWKHPGHWGLPTTEEELKNVIEQYGGLAAYEQAVMRARKEMARRADKAAEDSTPMDTGQAVKLQRLTNLGAYPPYVTIVSTEDFGKRKYNTEELAKEDEFSKIEETRREPRDQVPQRRTSMKETASRAASVKSQSSEESVDRTLIRVDTSYFEDALEDDLKDERLKKKIHSKHEEDDQRDQNQARTRTTYKTQTVFNSSPRKSIPRKVSTLSKTMKGVNDEDTEKDFSEEESTKLRREKANDNVQSDNKRRETDYKAPKFFKVHKQSRKITAKDPFSTDRDLNVPKGPAFQLKKSGKKPTEFVDFKRGDRGWTAPKKFEIKHKTRSKDGHSNETDVIDADADGDGKETEGSFNYEQNGSSPDSGLDNSPTDASPDAENEHLQNNDEPDDDLLGDAVEQNNNIIIDTEGDFSDNNSGKDKPEKVLKKSRVEFSTPPHSPPRLPSLPVTSHVAVTPPVSPPPESLSPILELPPLPEVDIPEVPKLPDIVEKEPEQGKQKEKVKFMVDVPPQLQVKEEPKRRRAAPKIRSIPRKMYRHRKTRPAEAPVTSEELKDIHDPLDFLARWCIINPDRLPFYELVFEYTIADQTPLYTKPEPLEQPESPHETGEEVNPTDNAEILSRKVKNEQKKGQSKQDNDHDNDHDQQLNTKLLPAERSMNFMKATMTVEEQHLEKLIYTLDLLHDKMINLGNSLEELEAKRIKMLASKARETFPHIASPNYTAKKKKGKNKKKKEKQSAQKLKAHEITDAIIVDRLSGKMLSELCREQDMKFLESEIEIVQDKIREVQRRVEDIAREKLLTDAFCMNHYFLRQGIHSQSEDFKRQQSELYNRLHPAPDFEMNLEEVEGALQQINNHLLTKREFNFLYNVLNLPGREKINFRLFTVIAALSEKVTQLDPVIRKMINNFDYNALDIKMEKCKELFGLLDMDHMPQGAAQAESLAVELTAGGLKPEHTGYVLNKFNRESKGAIDFLDFVTYIPLFVEIHKRIVQDPLKADLDL